MKRISLLFICILSVLNCSALIHSWSSMYVGSEGNGASSGSFDTSTGVLSISGTGAMPDYSAENKSPWNEFLTEIKIVKLSSGITSIGENAFSGCYNLTTIVIPDKVRSIGKRAFSGCNKLTSVSIGCNVDYIGDGAFYGCTAINDIYNFSTPQVITSQVFSNYSAVLHVFKKYASLYDSAEFWNRFSINEGIILKGSCGDLVSYTLDTETGLLSITGTGAMTNENSISSVPWYNYRSYIKTVNIADGVTSIGYISFYDCSDLTSVTIPNSVTSIGNYAFHGCYIENKDFTNNSILDAESNKYWGANIIEDRSLGFFSKDGILKKYFGNQDSFTIPDYITSIGSSAFSDCYGLTSVTIPNSVTSIGGYAFSGCSSLTSIEIPNSVTSIGESAFARCSGLTSITIGNSVTTISNKAFYCCSNISSITIPNSVTSIGDNVFIGCSSLYSVIIGSGLKSIGDYLFNSNKKPSKVIWLANTPPENYKYSSGSINYVGNNQYSFDFSANSIIYPFLSSMFDVDGVIYVPVSPSERTCDAIDCVYDDSITEININPTVSYKGVNMKVQNVQPYTFYNNTSIQKASVGIDGNIGNYVFSRCTNLKTVEIGKAVTGIGEYAFQGCSKLESLTIPDAVIIIGDYAFSDCSAMKSVAIGNKTNQIGNYVFQGCSSLQNIIIPGSVNNIGNYAFSGCNGLNNVVMVESKDSDLIIPFNDRILKNNETIKIDVYAGYELSFSYKINNDGYLQLGGLCLQDKSGTFNEMMNFNYPFYLTFHSNSSSNDNTCDITGMKLTKSNNNLSIGSNGSSPLFTGCPLDSVYIGRNISYNTSSDYGYSPFYRNASLRAVTITDKETEISENEFYGCTNLQNVQIGDSVTSIGSWAFSGCSSLKNFSFGTQLQTIGKEAFSDCTAVTSITSKAQTPPTCDSQALDDINKWDCKLYVPKGYVADYQSADQWKEFFFIEEEKSVLRGDANGDGEIGMPDVMFVVNYILGNPAETFNEEAADANLDGEIGMPDVMFIVNYILNGKFPDEE